jgi:hypothetical protein
LCSDGAEAGSQDQPCLAPRNPLPVASQSTEQREPVAVARCPVWWRRPVTNKMLRRACLPIVFLDLCFFSHTKHRPPAFCSSPATHSFAPRSRVAPPFHFIKTICRSVRPGCSSRWEAPALCTSRAPFCRRRLTNRPAFLSAPQSPDTVKGSTTWTSRGRGSLQHHSGT